MEQRVGLTLKHMMEKINDKIVLPVPADKILSDFIDKIFKIQPLFIDGIYLTGSLSMNDFYSNKSDIDFLVLCKELPGSEIGAQLKHIHKTIQKRFPKPDLSGCYLTAESIRTEDVENIKVLSYHRGSIHYRNFEMAPVSLWELKTNAFTLYGEKSANLPVYVKPDVLYKFLYENINSYWSKWVKGHRAFLRYRLLLFVFPRLTEWVLLGVARQLYTLQTGKIASKTEAGKYCLKILPGKFHPIIKDAIRIRQDDRTFPFVKLYSIKPSFKRLSKTLECANFIIDTFNEIYFAKLQHGDW